MPLPEVEVRVVAAILGPALRALGTGAVAGAAMPPALDDASIARWLQTLDDGALAAVLARFAANPHVARALARLQPAAHDAPRSRNIFGRPVVDRDSLFNHIATMHAGARTVLYVSGDQFAGKTFSKWIVQHEVQRFGHRYADIDLHGAFTLQSILQHVITWLQPAMSPPVFTDTNNTEDNWARACAQYVFTCATASRDDAVWLVFDHFVRASPSTAATVFFVRLVELVATQPGRPAAMRLILIDHGVPAPISARHGTLEDYVRFPGAADIARFYRARQPTWSQEAVDAAVQRVLAAMDAVPPRERMQRLEAELT